jgi:hypothetical protein
MLPAPPVTTATPRPLPTSLLATFFFDVAICVQFSDEIFKYAEPPWHRLQPAEKVVHFVILSEAKNLSGFPFL